MNSRKAQFATLVKEKVFDLIIVGGGASGLGIAVDASSRGLETVLFEWHDFAKGTSSKSTKLVHGGVRYLQQGDVKMVKEALLERGLLEKNARHLFKRQEFIIPNYTWWGGLYYTIGLKLYDLLAKKFSLGKSTLISRAKTIAALPTLKTKGLQKGVSYYDGQFDDARLAVNLAQTASDQGAVVMNHMRVVDLLSDAEGHATGVVVKDMETQAKFTVHAKVVVNAAGIFTDKILKLKDTRHKKTVVPSQGVHLVLDADFLQSETALMIPKTADGRVLFIIPWNSKVLAGTTDTLIKKPKIEPVALESEIEFILNTIGQYLTRVPRRDEVRSVFVGLRPLAKPKKDETNTKEVSRSHKILSEQGVVTIVGGKWTTYRKMAEDVLDTIIADYGFHKTPSITKTLAIRGNIQANQLNTPAHLQMYGSDLEAYLSFQESDPTYDEVLHSNYAYTLGQVAWAVREEMARSVEDVLARRIRLLFLDAQAAIQVAPKVAEILAKELQKDSEWKQAQLGSFKKLANQYLLD